MKTIAPLEPGSSRTIVSASVANALVDGANSIKRMRGGYGVGVVHSQSGIRVDLKNGTTFNELFLDRKSTRLNSSHIPLSRMPSSA